MVLSQRVFIQRTFSRGENRFKFSGKYWLRDGSRNSGIISLVFHFYDKKYLPMEFEQYRCHYVNTS